jgi:hypothetical protein
MHRRQGTAMSLHDTPSIALYLSLSRAIWTFRLLDFLTFRRFGVSSVPPHGTRARGAHLETRGILRKSRCFHASTPVWRAKKVAQTNPFAIRTSQTKARLTLPPAFPILPKQTPYMRSRSQKRGSRPGAKGVSRETAFVPRETTLRGPLPKAVSRETDWPSVTWLDRRTI